MNDKEKVAQWMIERGFATGHGDSVEDLLAEIEWQIAERERQACIDLCDKIEKEAYQTYHRKMDAYDEGVGAGARACMEEIARRGK